MDNPGENKENTGLVSANSIGKCRQNSTSYKQELKTPKTSTRSTNKPRQKPNTRAALQSTNVNNKIKSDLSLPTRSKSQVPEWLSRLPLVEIPVDYSQSPFPKRQRTKNPPYQHIGCPRTRDWLSYLDFVRQATRTNSKLHHSDRSQQTLVSRLTIT